ARGRVHLDRAFSLYDPAEHRSLATRFGQDVGAATLCWRSIACWLLGYPQDALIDIEHALKIALEIGHSATLLDLLNFSICPHIQCRQYVYANELVDEFTDLKDATELLFWEAWGIAHRGCSVAATGTVSKAVQKIHSGVSAMRQTEATMWMTLSLSNLT